MKIFNNDIYLLHDNQKFIIYVKGYVNVFFNINNFLFIVSNYNEIFSN
jgi:hypothetical protein